MHICHGILFHRHAAPYTASVFGMRYTQRFEENKTSISINYKLYQFQNLKKYIETQYPDHLFHCTSEIITSEDVLDEVVLKLPEVEQLGYVLESDKEPCSVSGIR